MFRLFSVTSMAFLVLCRPGYGEQQTSYPVFGILQVDPSLRSRGLRLQEGTSFNPVHQRTLIYRSDSAELRQLRDAKAREGFSAPVLTVLGLSAFTVLAGEAAVPHRRPNVLYVFSDMQQGRKTTTETRDRLRRLKTCRMATTSG